MKKVELEKTVLDLSMQLYNTTNNLTELQKVVVSVFVECEKIFGLVSDDVVKEKRETEKINVVKSIAEDEYLKSMSIHQISAIMKRWIELHFYDKEISPGQVERVFVTPVQMYLRNMRDNRKNK